jgi:hypothetical protein
MKLVLLFPFLSLGILPVNSRLFFVTENESSSVLKSYADDNSKGFNILSQPSPENEKMLAVVFRSQDVCRAELKDFVYDVQFNVVNATVYFSGAGFRGVETGFITSNSLKPIRNLMARCVPGTMVVFDNVKVKGPDDTVRPIQGTSYMLK